MSLTQNSKFMSLPDYELQETSAQICRQYLTTPISRHISHRDSSHWSGLRHQSSYRATK